ncbi:MAG: hypothetical protein AAFY98_06025 [Verrucomicrobiota bacterium]
MKLSVIEDVFEISGRGCVVVPGIPRDISSDRKVWRGACISLHLPDGRNIETHIEEIEMIRYGGGSPPDDIAFLLPKKFKKSDIPIGTEIYLEDNKQNKSAEETA